MAISSDSIFHFTNSFDSFKSILSDGLFKTAYCLESYDLDILSIEAAIPMICFSDIPLTMITSQVRNYGKFAIGLNKKWAAAKKLNPVNYVQRNSSYTNMIEPIIYDTLANDPYGSIDIRHTMEKINEHEYLIKNAVDDGRMNKIRMVTAILSFTKNYSGILKRNGKVVKKEYKYYDEREWRYVPSEEEFKQKRLKYYSLMDGDEYREWRSKSTTKSLIPDLFLEFDHSNIEYLVVSNDKERKLTIEHLKQCHSLFSNDEQMKILISKIFTIEQINRDF